jgi:hypothetical protein
MVRGIHCSHFPSVHHVIGRPNVCPGVVAVASKLCVWTGRGSTLGRDKIFSSPKLPDQLRGLPSFIFSGHRDSFARVKRPVLMLTTHLHLTPTLRISGAILLVPLYSFVARTGKTLPLFILYSETLGVS